MAGLGSPQNACHPAGADYPIIRPGQIPYGGAGIPAIYMSDQEQRRGKALMHDLLVHCHILWPGLALNLGRLKE